MGNPHGGLGLQGGGQVLLLSMRGLAKLVAYCTIYEFEDVIAEVTRADRIDVSDERALEFSRRTYKLLRYATGSSAFARRTAALPATVRLDRDYELFFPVFNHTHELYALRSVPDWRRRCRFAACFVSEVWAHLLPKYLLELLAQFDHVFVGMRHCVEDVARIVGRPCTYLPVAADVSQFSPGPQPPARTIDVCNIGRRSPVTHGALIELARARELCYYYDTFAGGAGKDRAQRTFMVHDHREHRLLLAQLLMRAKYYVANRSRVNQPQYTGANQEISYRFYEGIAAGAVLLGDPPDTDAFREQFDWPDAAIRVPFDCPEIGQVLADLERDPQRLSRIRAQNMAQAALRHDWVHRLGQVFRTFGLSATEGMRERQMRLDAIAQSSRKVAA
ncbi:MAG TPA: glycosyltransferase [Steroidobacteraceae bacterium]|nr:glycosyltransferase [Steroidobacteraceae bacterium]